jgi:hypothetical protein
MISPLTVEKRYVPTTFPLEPECFFAPENAARLARLLLAGKPARLRGDPRGSGLIWRQGRERGEEVGV